VRTRHKYNEKMMTILESDKGVCCYHFFNGLHQWSKLFRWRVPDPDLQLCWQASLKFFNTIQFTRFFIGERSLLHKIFWRFIDRLLRAAQKVPGSRMRPSEPGLRTTGFMNWIVTAKSTMASQSAGAGSTVYFLQAIWYLPNSLQHALDQFSAAWDRAGM